MNTQSGHNHSAKADELTVKETTKELHERFEAFSDNALMLKLRDRIIEYKVNLIDA